MERWSFFFGGEILVFVVLSCLLVFVRLSGHATSRRETCVCNESPNGSRYSPSIRSK